jgi:hypothetical protein
LFASPPAQVSASQSLELERNGGQSIARCAAEFRPGLRALWVKTGKALTERKISASPPIAEARIGGPNRRSGPTIGIGGSLAAPPLPHHRTYGSVYGGSRKLR